MRIAIYGRPTGALLAVAVVLAAAGNAPQWRDPKYFKPTEKDVDVDAVVIDPASPNADVIAETHRESGVTVHETADEVELRSALGLPDKPEDEPETDITDSNGVAVEKLPYPKLRVLVKSAELEGLNSNPSKQDIIAALIAKGITHVPAESDAAVG